MGKTSLVLDMVDVQEHDSGWRWNKFLFLQFANASYKQLFILIAGNLGGASTRLNSTTASVLAIDSCRTRKAFCYSRFVFLFFFLLNPWFNGHCENYNHISILSNWSKMASHWLQPECEQYKWSCVRARICIMKLAYLLHIPIDIQLKSDINHWKNSKAIF